MLSSFYFASFIFIFFVCLEINETDFEKEFSFQINAVEGEGEQPLESLSVREMLLFMHRLEADTFFSLKVMSGGSTNSGSLVLALKKPSWLFDKVQYENDAFLADYKASLLSYMTSIAEKMPSLSMDVASIREDLAKMMSIERPFAKLMLANENEKINEIELNAAELNSRFPSVNNEKFSVRFSFSSSSSL